MSMCEFHNHSCVCCLEHHIEAEKYSEHKTKRFGTDITKELD